ncbi:PTS lactose transporter subunit IIBC [Companilactobacillus zhachilii]|uniref:PTS lactose transporter subunit IIBC n=1 Tax=Companilactobacillus zhachilii TaxID=2304606 RepID=A0A386PSZ3_9LACO|nr:PTS fructose transporter subunit IIC [Companilactobacillus zhachilii]AYE39191.1 PTS lactose transporter subunit IIBC [Companilactobacillus zhachilii]
MAQGSVKKFGKELSQHFMTGVSYMIPIVTAGGLLTSFAVIFGGTGVWNQTSNIWGNMRMIGTTALGLIVPIIAAYISYSIADKPGLAPAFICGMVANTLHTGFLGGMLVGVLTGYLVQWMKKIPISPRIMALKTIIIIPVFSSLIIGFLMIYVVGTPIAVMTQGLTDWLTGMKGSNAAILGVIIGAMMAVDMGGPINKIANTFGLACFASGVYGPSTAMLMAISIPPLGMFLATIIGKKYYTKEEIENGRSALIMGIIGITEGTIPFAVADPLTVIPSIVVGSSVTCGLNAFFGVTQKTALSTVMAIPFTSNPLIYIACILVGVVITAFMVNFLKSLKAKKKATKDVAAAVDQEMVGEGVTE